MHNSEAAPVEEAGAAPDLALAGRSERFCLLGVGWAGFQPRPSGTRNNGAD